MTSDMALTPSLFWIARVSLRSSAVNRTTSWGIGVLRFVMFAMYMLCNALSIPRAKYF